MVVGNANLKAKPKPSVDLPRKLEFRCSLNRMSDCHREKLIYLCERRSLYCSQNVQVIFLGALRPVCASQGEGKNPLRISGAAKFIARASPSNREVTIGIENDPLGQLVTNFPVEEMQACRLRKLPPRYCAAHVRC